MKLLENIKPQSEGQRRLLEVLRNDSYAIVGVFGPTGSGKSLFSLAYGIESVAVGKFKRFVVVKPVIDVVTGRELTLAEAGEEYSSLAREYLIDVLGAFIDQARISELIDSGKLIVIDGHYLKGRTFDESLIFIDDAQHVHLEILLEVIVRIGSRSRLIIAADPIFQTLRGIQYDHITTLREILLSESNAQVVDLGVEDIVREGAKTGVRFLLEYILRSRKLQEVEAKAIQVMKLHSPDADIVTVVEIEDIAKKHGISLDHVPKYLVVVKPGHLGRLVGKGGERISAIEKELGGRVRGIELDLDLTSYIRSIHPVSWIWKRTRIDLVGPYLAIKIESDNLGPLVGQKGSYIRFLEEVTMKLMGLGVRIIPTSEGEEVEKSRRKSRKSSRGRDRARSDSSGGQQI
ncbi:MAG: PhoH family protein [Sulfolobales archaeon]|nr:PhoH family protein [Sulfolobales archaeon]MDW8082218.1 PhoH family protein [Sulfolobales archaeon]